MAVEIRAATYAALRTALAAGTYQDKQQVFVESIDGTNTNGAGTFKVKYDAGGGFVDDSGVTITSADGKWAAERVFDGGACPAWFEGANDTERFAAALASDAATIQLLGKSYQVDVFGVTLTGGTNAAIHVDRSVKIFGPGVIESNTVFTSRALFGIDNSAGENNVAICGVTFSGGARYSAIYVDPAAVLNEIVVQDNITSRQTIAIGGDFVSTIRVTNNKIGRDVLSNTNVSPYLSVVLVNGSANSPECIVRNNLVRTGTESIAGAAITAHGLSVGGLLESNTHQNVGSISIEGFDIDNVGRFVRVVNNVAVGSGFEYKTGSRGFSGSRDVVFSGNVSISADVSFSIRSSCVGFGNIAFDPNNYGLFASSISDVDGLIDKAAIDLSGFKIIYGGSVSWVSAVKIDAGARSFRLSDFQIEIDPAWADANPGGKIPGVQINIDGDITSLSISETYIGPSTGDQINVRPTTRADNLRFENIEFDDNGDSCIDLLNCDHVQILNPIFPANIGDRPIRLTTCDMVRIVSDYRANLSLSQTSGASTGVLINNFGQEAAGAGNRPDATDRWPLGCVVTNTDDATVWLRVSESTTPSTAWVAIS